MLIRLFIVELRSELFLVNYLRTSLSSEFLGTIGNICEHGYPHRIFYYVENANTNILILLRTFFTSKSHFYQ